MRGFSISGDGYARAQPSGISHLVEPSPGGILFVDIDMDGLDIDAFLGLLRSIRPSAVGNAQRTVFRSPVIRRPDGQVLAGGVGWHDIDESRRRIVQALTNHRIRTAQVAVVEFPVVAEPIVSGDADSSVLARCRAVELEALLQSTNAIWTPDGYHYRLPSGDHARSFVRVAEVFRDFRSAAALGSWLHGLLEPSQLLVVDSGTLSPLVHYLKYIAALAFSQPFHGGVAHVLSVENYPRSHAELRQALGQAEHMNTLGLLSVSSSGATHKSIQNLLANVTPTWRTECLIDRKERRPQTLPLTTDKGTQVAWLGLSEQSPQIYPEGLCELCKSSSLSPLVQIHFSNFAAVALPEPKLIMPDVSDALRNRPLFDAYMERSEGLQRGLVHLTTKEVSRQLQDPNRRTPNDHRIRFEPIGLLATSHEILGKQIQDRLSALQNLLKSDKAKKVIEPTVDELLDADQTAVVLSSFEMAVVTRVLDTLSTPEDAAAFVLEALKPSFPSLKEAILSPDITNAASTSEFEDRVREHESFLFFSTGLQTGITLQHLVVDVQDAFRVGNLNAGNLADPQMTGLVLHAHPSDRRAWRSVRNTFIGGPKARTRLLALWLTYLPEQSPFHDELQLLQRLDTSTLSAPATKLVSERLSWLSPSASNTVPPPSPLLSPTSVSLRRTSIYGLLDDRYSLAAVGTAMQSEMERASSSEALQWIQFDLPNVFRSYFDGLLHAAVIRWGTPTSLWWGNGTEPEALLLELRGRFEDSPNGDWHLLLCELLLASAQGKVPSEAAVFLEAEAGRRLNAEPPDRWSDEALNYVEMCAALADQFRIEND